MFLKIHNLVYVLYITLLGKQLEVLCQTAVVLRTGQKLYYTSLIVY